METVTPSDLLNCYEKQTTFISVDEILQSNSHQSNMKQELLNKEDKEFWQQAVQDYKYVTSNYPRLLAFKLRTGGIPHQLRGAVWRSMAQYVSMDSLYDRLSEQPSPYNRIIQRDLSRTFPQLDLFKDDGGEGQLAMGRLLRAYSVYDAHVGYCQGLAFLVGPLLLTMSEKQAFSVFVSLMEVYDMKTMFTVDMEGLHLCLYQFECLLSELCPRLDAHFKKHAIQTAMYASQWYLTLFAYSFPLSLVLRIYDLVFAEGAVETMTRVAAAIMQKNQDILLAIDDFEQLMLYLRSNKLYTEVFQSDPDQLITEAMALSTIITKQKLDTIAKTYTSDTDDTHTRQALDLISTRETPSEDILAELLNVKLAHFELSQKYTGLIQEHEQTTKQVTQITEGQAALLNKLMILQTTMDSVQLGNEQLKQERNELLDENQILLERVTTIKQTCTDLQSEKLTLENENQCLQERVKELENQREKYLMPRESFTEEVLAAHQSLFETKAVPSCRHTEYQQKYMESDLQCRELEKLLAEAKFKLAEYEANKMHKRYSFGLMSPPLTNPRGSLESFQSQTSSSKRSSLVSRLFADQDP